MPDASVLVIEPVNSPNSTGGAGDHTIGVNRT